MKKIVENNQQSSPSITPPKTTSINSASKTTSINSASKTTPINSASKTTPINSASKTTPINGASKKKYKPTFIQFNFEAIQ